jgi:NitT/TauT family transport system substrate-binding protein
VPQLLQAIDSGLDLVIVAGANMMSPEAAEFAAVVRKGESLRAPADFVGRKIGVNTIGSFLHVLFVQWLKNHGVDPQKVTFVEVSFPQMGDVLRQGTVDAVVSVEPFIGRMVSADVGTATDAFVRDFPKGMPVAVYAADRAWANQHLAELRNFRVALRQATEFLAAHPEQARTDTLKYLKMPPQALAAAHLPDISVDLSPDGIKEWIKILRGQKLLNTELDANHILLRD